ncbi:MAG: hypothetical protein D6729_16170 [Deltaproteobacteria bacterium]|nr:MAG: hypothetical protein D6729_16170 [Deltaproteobacteria bacterium]
MVSRHEARGVAETGRRYPVPRTWAGGLGTCALLFVVLVGSPSVRAAPATGAGDTRAERPRLLVLDLVHRGTPAKARALIDGEVTGALRDTQRYQVVSQNDVRTLLGIEAQRQLLGCEEESCLSEIAGALGAEEVVVGTSVHLEHRTQVRLKRIDTTEARVLRDVAVSATSLDELLELVRRAAFDLVDAPWKPRAHREVAWAEETVEIGAALRLVSYPPRDSGAAASGSGGSEVGGSSTSAETGVGPVLLMGYAFRSKDVAFGLRLATGVSQTSVRWDDLFEPYEERVDLATIRGGLLLRWPATGGIWLRPYVTTEIGVMRVRAHSRAEDAPEWLHPTSGQAYGPYLMVGGGLRFFPRARIGFALEAGVRLAPAVGGIVDHDLPVAGAEAPPVPSAKERGGIHGVFILGTLRRAL